MTAIGSRTASEPRYEVRLDLDVRVPDLDVRVPARDGVELSANVWLPLLRPHVSDAPGRAVPAILEMIPWLRHQRKSASRSTSMGTASSSARGTRRSRATGSEP